MVVVVVVVVVVVGVVVVVVVKANILRKERMLSAVLSPA